jgi:hypothetical protein
MIELIKSRLNLKADSSSYDEYKKCIGDLAKNEAVRSNVEIITDNVESQSKAEKGELAVLIRLIPIVA